MKRRRLHATVVGLSCVQAASATPSGEQLLTWQLPAREVMLKFAVP
jgi:hypothetical protein